jgi:hypothetical protein
VARDFRFLPRTDVMSRNLVPVMRIVAVDTCPAANILLRRRGQTILLERETIKQQTIESRRLQHRKAAA